MEEKNGRKLNVGKEERDGREKNGRKLNVGKEERNGREEWKKVKYGEGRNKWKRRTE